MWRIGGLELAGPAVLGPMSGFTTRGYRDFMRPFGAAASVTEMVSDSGVVHGTERTEGYCAPGEGPTGLQLFGRDPETMAAAAAAALSRHPGIAFVDVNMGCPAAKVVRKGCGSALMDDPARCADVVRAVKRAADVPVTAKMRLGSRSLNFREVIRQVVGAGADAVAVHARTRAEGYSGAPHMDMLEGLQSEMPVPLVVSGGIYTAEDAARAVRVTGAAGVMVARGGVGNPLLLTQIDRRLRFGESVPDPTVSQQVRWCRELASALVSEMGAEQAAKSLRSIAPRFISGCPGCRGYRRRIAAGARTLEELDALLDEVDGEMGSETVRSCRRASVRGVISPRSGPACHARGS